MRDSNLTSTNELDEIDQLFRSGTASSSRDAKPDGEATMAAQLTGINAELSRVRKDIEKILGLLKGEKQPESIKHKPTVNLDDYTDLWSDLTEEEYAVLKQSFDAGISFPEPKIDLS